MANNFPERAEPCADVLDQATKFEEMERSHSVRAASDACAPQKHHLFDGTHCVEEDCGVVIPGVRLKAGRVRCTDCETLLEQARKQRGRF